MGTRAPFGVFFLTFQTLYPFLVEIKNQHPKIDPCAKFEPNRTKDKGFRPQTWQGWHHQNFLFLRDFVQEYHPAKFGLQTNEKHGRGDFLFFALYFTKIAQP